MRGSGARSPGTRIGCSDTRQGDAEGGEPPDAAETRPAAASTAGLEAGTAHRRGDREIDRPAAQNWRAPQDDRRGNSAGDGDMVEETALGEKRREALLEPGQPGEPVHRDGVACLTSHVARLGHV